MDNSDQACMLVGVDVAVAVLIAFDCPESDSPSLATLNRAAPKPAFLRAFACPKSMP